MSRASKTAVIAWLIAAVYYFYQYVLRSAPAVMMPELSQAFGLTTAAVASMVGVFYYGYSWCSLIAGVALDRLGPKRVIPIGAVVLAVGALLFASNNGSIATTGRLLQGAGGAFAFVGAAYIATTHFPAANAGMLLGATQMFGMAGGSAGQFVVGPVIAAGVGASTFWTVMGVAGLSIAVVLFVVLPREKPLVRTGVEQPDNWVRSTIAAMITVIRNPQSILCGIIAGLLFIPTTIFDMVWGVRFLQEARGYEYASAVMRSASVPLGWMIGCPLLGALSDRIGRRKPVIIAGASVLLVCLAWILFGPADVLPPYSVGLVAGVASGSAMVPLAVMKESNPPEVGGTATGVFNFLNFTFSALLGPVFSWLLTVFSTGSGTMTLEQFQSAFGPFLFGVALAIVLTLCLRETGSAMRRAVPVAAGAGR